MNDSQTVAVVASQEDGIYYNLETERVEDLDEAFEISSVTQVVHDAEERCFYMLCNRFASKTGIYLIKFDEDDPQKFNFFLNWHNKLEISDSYLSINRENQSHFKELIVAFKTIYMNTYSVIVVDISTSNHWMLFKHESYQLWESKISAFCLKNNHTDFVVLDNEGISVYGLGNEDKRIIKSETHQELMLHSFDSVSYLKLDKKNYITFDFSDQDKRYIVISH